MVSISKTEGLDMRKDFTIGVHNLIYWSMPSPGKENFMKVFNVQYGSNIPMNESPFLLNSSQK